MTFITYSYTLGFTLCTCHSKPWFTLLSAEVAVQGVVQSVKPSVYEYIYQGHVLPKQLLQKGIEGRILFYYYVPLTAPIRLA